MGLDISEIRCKYQKMIDVVMAIFKNLTAEVEQNKVKIRDETYKQLKNKIIDYKINIIDFLTFSQWRHSRQEAF